MFELLDTAAAIREVQKFLYVISDRIDGSIERVAIDGIYGEETKNAVSSFQANNFLPITGEVDRITFEKLYSLYKKAVLLETVKDFVITQAGFPIKTGDQNDDVLIINIMLTELKNTFTEITPVVKSTYYSKATELAVKDLQKRMRLFENGEVDEIFYQRMKEELLASDRLYEIYQ